ncbi:SRPBCC family protein [Streptomyces showdoensis]|uniref:Cyclase n=1 Tax=Streptomyces showdoensis TaxID=68268 RepID=A0A2P2GUR7_STREW|nr:cyclase [Streptomyces showdoensis]
MTMVQETIKVDAPLREVYDQWTQFEEFPVFMEGVEEVHQVDDRLCHWRTRFAGVTREFDTEIVDQLADERISWRTVDGDVRQKGVVTFQRVDDSHTRVSLAMEIEPQGVVEKAGTALGIVESRVQGDLERFKHFIEERDAATGAWRGRLRPAEAPSARASELRAGPGTDGAPVGETPAPPGRPGPYPGPLPDDPHM